MGPAFTTMNSHIRKGPVWKRKLLIWKNIIRIKHKSLLDMIGIKTEIERKKKEGKSSAFVLYFFSVPIVRLFLLSRKVAPVGLP